MEQEIKDQGPRRCSAHCGTEEERKQLNAVDVGIATSKLTAANIKLFIKALSEGYKDEVKKVFNEKPRTGVPCIHIEVKADK